MWLARRRVSLRLADISELGSLIVFIVGSLARADARPVVCLVGEMQPTGTESKHIFRVGFKRDRQVMWV